jgi:hypothetical protein
LRVWRNPTREPTWSLTSNLPRSKSTKQLFSNTYNDI